MQILGASLAEQALGGESEMGRNFHVVTTVEDFDALACPIIDKLEAAGNSVVFSCIWPAEKQIGAGPRGEVVTIAMSADEEPFDDENTYLVLVRSVTETTTMLETMFTHAHPAPDMTYRGLWVLSPIVHVDAKRNFKAAIPRRYRDSLTWESNRTDPFVSRQRQLSPGIGMKIWQRMGLRSPNSNRALMPKRVLDSIENHLRPSYGM
jgi:hypothetical protein